MDLVADSKVSQRSAALIPASLCVLCCVVLLCQVDLFSYRRVFVPVHVHGNHWCLGCLNVEARRIEYYDSLGGSNDTFFHTMRQYLSDEWAAHHPQQPPLQLSDWTTHCPKHIPRQDNGSDCGVFTLKFADYLSHQPTLNHTNMSTHTQQHFQLQKQQQLPSSASTTLAVSGESQLDFSASDMEYFRNRIALEIKLQRVM